MNLQEILEQNDLVMSINNNFNVLSFYIPEIKCMVEFNQNNHNINMIYGIIPCYLYLEQKRMIILILMLDLLLLLHDIGQTFCFLLKDLLDIIIMFRELLLRWLMLF